MNSTFALCVADVVVVAQSIEEAGVAEDAVSSVGYETDRGVAHSNCALSKEIEATR
ncbi:MAG: hypothetical protein M0Z45_03675 [Actinomycetota bacterium]|nr:hypothetical protein [Actinomycetota bacterium]